MSKLTDVQRKYVESFMADIIEGSVQTNTDRVLRNFLQNLDDKAYVHASEEGHSNVRIDMIWPTYNNPMGFVEGYVTQALARQVFTLREAGIDEPIWIDFDTRKLVVSFADAETAMLFKLSQS